MSRSQRYRKPFAYTLQPDQLAAYLDGQATAPALIVNHGPLAVIGTTAIGARSCHTHWLLRDHVPANQDDAFLLGLPPGQTLTRLHCLRHIGQQTRWLDYTLLPAGSPLGLEQVQLAGERATDHIDQPGARSLQMLNAQNADAHMARLLDLPPGSPLLELTRLSLNQQGQVTALSRIYGSGEQLGVLLETRRLAGDPMPPCYRRV